jgi:hypothetical protein
MKILFTVLFMSLVIAVFADNEDPKQNSDSKSETSKTVVVNGKIIDSVSKENLVGVKVNIGETGIVTYTDFNGNFSISIPNNMVNNELRVSYISYQETTVDVINNNNSIIEIKPVK